MLGGGAPSVWNDRWTPVRIWVFDQVSFLVQQGRFGQCMNETVLAGRSFRAIVCWQRGRGFLTNRVLALLHNPLDYPPQTEGESLEQIRAYASQTPFVTGGVPSHVSVRPDGYGVLGLPMLHSMPQNGAKGSRYSSNPGAQDVPP